jgi:hypothetical protein
VASDGDEGQEREHRGDGEGGPHRFMPRPIGVGRMRPTTASRLAWPRRPAPASLLAARFMPSPLSHATFASGERERIGFRKKGENPTREKNEKRKRGKGAGKEKENRGKGNKLFTFYKLCFENYSNQIIIG